jgi:hypothetical protein
VVVLHNSDAEATGLAGTLTGTSMPFFLVLIKYNIGTKIGRVKVLFQLPKASSNAAETLAYIEWYTPPRRNEETHNMHSIRKMDLRADGSVNASIVPLANIRQTCQLFPNFGRTLVDEGWTTNNVLDKCQSFFVNNWAGLYAYQTIW